MTADWNYDSDDNKNGSNFSVKKSRSRTKSPTQGGSNDLPKETNIQSKTNPRPEPSTCIGVFGLSKKTVEKTLWNTFEIFGKIKSVSLIVDKFTKESLGFAFINYEDLDSSSNAIKETNGMILDTKTIRVDYSLTKKAYTPTPGSGYKGKISRRGRDNDKRKFSKKYLARSRSRSYEGKHSAMKYLNGRNSPVNNLTCSRVPMKYSVSRDSHMRYETRKSSPVPHYSRHYSPERNNSRYYSPPRSIDRGHSSLRRDYRGYSPERDIKRELYFQSNESRRYSPVRGYSPQRSMNREYSPQRSMNREYSPPRSHLRGYSPVRNEHRNYSPDKSVKMEYSIRHGFSEYSPKQDRRFSSTKLDPYTLRNGVQIYSPTKSNVRSFSPERKSIRVYSPMNRPTSPVRSGYRHYSPDKCENFKDPSIINENQRFFY